MATSTVTLTLYSKQDTIDIYYIYKYIIISRDKGKDRDMDKDMDKGM